MGEATRDATRRLQSEIEDARAHMAFALDELQDRLRPQRVMADAKEAIRSSVREQVDDVVERTRQTASDVLGQARQAATDVTGQARQAASGMIDRARDHPAQTALLSALGVLLMMRPLGQRMGDGSAGRMAAPLGLSVSALTTAAIVYASWQSGRRLGPPDRIGSTRTAGQGLGTSVGPGLGTSVGAGL